MEEDARPEEISSTLKRTKRQKLSILILSIVVTLYAALTLSFVLYIWDRGEIANGVVLEIPLGQLRLEEARLKLAQMSEEIVNRPVLFISEGKTLSLTMKELGFSCAYDEPLQQAYLIGREGTFLHQAISKYKASWGITFKPDYQWNDVVLKEALTKQLAGLNLPAEEARFSITSDNAMQIISEKPGKQVDIASLIGRVKKLGPDQAEMIPVPFNTLAPLVTKIDLEAVKMTGLLSTYTTQYNPNQKERTHNIMLAAKAIDGRLLKPGEEFSFNQTVGPRTVESGYQTAIVIEGDQFVPGLGGGICQVSSTLYNAVRLGSSLSITERSHHSLPVTYVPPGQDATVAYPFLDFKFRNDSEGYLLIRTLVNSNTVAISIYGKKKTST